MLWLPRGSVTRSNQGAYSTGTAVKNQWMASEDAQGTSGRNCQEKMQMRRDFIGVFSGRNGAAGRFDLNHYHSVKRVRI